VEGPRTQLSPSRRQLNKEIVRPPSRSASGGIGSSQVTGCRSAQLMSDTGSNRPADDRQPCATRL